ncbi:MAG: GNAT family N-acetyltransferase [Eubacteriaceae bacterium]|jgi:hypothetical protein|nr:GNAT family N-acetyltransferase [Eubacteriaceae bacterium]
MKRRSIDNNAETAVKLAADDSLVGVIAARNKGSHIALAFVYSAYHRYLIYFHGIHQMMCMYSISSFSISIR